MTKTTSIAMIICWYGDYPWYFPYFIHSCKYNPSIDFIIITNNTNPIPNKPENVKIVFKNPDEIRNAASEKLGFTVNLEYPYKLCDFKPAYGFIFPEIIEGYDFWGHGDIDMVYGNIRDFMTEELLDNHDVVSSRHDFITGTFCLYRNAEITNTLFMQSRDYKVVFSRPEHFCFDECNFLFYELQSGDSIFDFPDRIQSMTYVVKKAEEEGKIRPFFDFIIVEGLSLNGEIKWDNGKVIYKNEFEGMYYNLIRMKNLCKDHVTIDPIPHVFYFTENDIVKDYDFK